MPAGEPGTWTDSGELAGIRDVIAAAERPLLPQEVLDEAQRHSPGLGMATVYRNLKALVEEGELCAVNLPGENPRFALLRVEGALVTALGGAHRRAGCQGCVPASCRWPTGCFQELGLHAE